MNTVGALGTLRRILLLACIVVGFSLVGPFAWLWATHRATVGGILEVFPTPLPDGRVRLSVLYQFSVDHAELLGYRIADDRCRPQDDLVVAPEEAARLMAAWRPTESRARGGRVLYEANDPAGTALMVVQDAVTARRQVIGMGLVLVALALSIPIRRR